MQRIDEIDFKLKGKKKSHFEKKKNCNFRYERANRNIQIKKKRK